MRAVLVLIVIVLVMVAVGWITFRSNGSNQATVTVDTQKIEDDTQRVIKKGGEAMEATGETIQDNLRPKASSEKRDSHSPNSTPDGVIE